MRQPYPSDEVPYNRKLGDEPALTAVEIMDVVAFINTLMWAWTMRNHFYIISTV